KRQHDRSAHSEAKLIPPEGSFSKATGIIEEICRIQSVVAQKLKSRTMELISAGFRHGDKNPACGAAVLRAVVCSKHPELFDRFDTDKQTLSAARRVVERIVNGSTIE